MTTEQKDKWLNWLDSCQNVIPQNDALNIMLQYMSKREMNRLFIQWMEER